MAACPALASILGTGNVQNVWFGISSETAALDNGHTITFIKSAAAPGAAQFDQDVAAM